MEKKVRITRISHRGDWKYCIDFPYDDKLTVISKKIPGAMWSKTNKGWTFPGDEASLRNILKAFKGQADVDISMIVMPERLKKSDQDLPAEDISATGREKGAVLTDEPDQPVTIREVERKAGSGGKYGPVNFSINEETGTLTIRFTGLYDKEWISELRSYGKAVYDPVRREWHLRWTKLTVDSLADYFMTRGIKIEFSRVDIPRKDRQVRADRGSELRALELGDDVKEGIEKVRRHMLERRYSKNTISAYTSVLELFFKYHSSRKPGEISEDDISRFFNDYVIHHKYSASFQNQAVSAIKVYYLLNGTGDIELSLPGRPRRVRALPKVFSKDEVMRILSSVRNLKHKMILWIIYSCGLRRSEVINIRLADIDRSRKILHIREAKGGIDRVVPVSMKVWDKLDEYMGVYSPKVYLFEGQGGGRYSTESVYHIFKDALRRAGINKEVGVHSLRHSYATHLHEGGLDIRYIQELLGHKSTRTTEIYTHVSRRNLIQVRSPIDDMDIN